MPTKGPGSATLPVEGVGADESNRQAAYVARLDRSTGYADLFRLVKDVTERKTRRSRAGIMLALSRLGLSPDGFLGGYFVLGSNAIVLNRDVLDYIKASQPTYLNAYAFHVLLHEYLHTLGWLREDEVRPMAAELSNWALGPEHPASVIAFAMSGGQPTDGPEFLKRLVYPPFGWAPNRQAPLEIVKLFDLDATPYIG
ncbi:MAG: hypothetical protein ACYDDF_01675 [Thermoplasmatota archaeon]